MDYRAESSVEQLKCGTGISSSPGWVCMGLVTIVSWME
jgi:hypothetical protein